MKLILTSFLLVFTFAVLAQENIKTQDAMSEIDNLKASYTVLKNENTNLRNEFNLFREEFVKLFSRLDSVRQKNDKITSELSTKILEMESKLQQSEADTNKRFSVVDQSLSKKTLYGIIIILIAALFSFILFWALKKKQNKSRSEVESQLKTAKKSIEEEQIQINTKLAELYNGQMELLRVERQNSPRNENMDHSLPLKVADEIVKMQMNLAHMDKTVRGHKQLSIAVNNVIDNFKANGYEIIDHLNKNFNDGMNMDASKEIDPNLKSDEQIITRVIKPEVHFNNKMIQKAQVIVSFGE